MKKLSLSLILAMLTIFLTACWDYSEIEDIAIASTIAIDIDRELGEYILNVEIIDIEGTREGINLVPIVVESRGKTLIDAARNMIGITSKTPYWAHTNMIIIGSDLARKGIAPILDWVGRNPETRLSVNVYISRNKTAKEILLASQEFTKIRTFDYEKLQESYELLSKMPIKRVSRVINQFQQPELFTVLPTIELESIEGETTSNFIGSAHFAKGKLVGYLSPLDTMKYLFIQDEIKGGILIIPVGQDENVSLDIYKSRTSINFEFQQGRIYTYVNIKTTVDIAEIDGQFDYTSREGRRLLKEKSDKYLEKEIEDFIGEFQRDVGHDIFAFGNKIKKKHWKIWKSIEKDWDSIFRDLDVIVNCDIEIKGSRNTIKPIEVK